MAAIALRPDSVRANPEPIADDAKRHRLSRRGLLGAMAVAPALCIAATQAVASSPLESLIDAHQAARERLNAAGKADAETLSPVFWNSVEDDYIADLDRLDDYKPQTAREFARHMSARFDDYSIPNDDEWVRIVDTARRLAAEGC